MDNVITYLDNNIIRVSFQTRLRRAAIETFIQDINPHVDKAKKPVHLLIDAEREGRWSRGARRKLTELLANDLRYGKVAVCNVSRFALVVARFVVQASGRSETMRIFDNEARALSWLKE